MRLFVAAAFLFTAPLFAQGDCTLTVSPISITVPATGFSGTITVTATGFSCSFSAVSQVNWIHITSDPGAAPVTFIVDTNQFPTPRTGTMTMALQTVTVTQSGRTDCAYGINPKSQNFAVGGGTGSFAVQANCPWSTSVNASWVTFPAGNQSGSSNATVPFAVAPNGCVAGRNASVAVVTGLLPPVLSITQDGSPANLTLSATSATAGPAAGDNRITVSTGDGCGWSAFSNVNWMQITSGSSGTGNGGIVYHLLENKSAVRSGSIQVGALTYTVTQQAPVAPPVVLTSVDNAANYGTDAVSPGEIVTLFGTNIGPASIVTLQVSGGIVTNSLAGTQVLFDSVAAPMIYTLAGQVSAVVPYGVAGKSSTKVQVLYQGVPSNTVTMPVQAATPGIFTLDTSGSGPGAILNQDSTLNSSANPAARGSIVAIYLTGTGVTTPSSADGSVTGAPPPLLPQTPTVTIGGVGAVVKYAGAAPGSLAGLTQINVEVPAATAPGLSLPVIVKVGSFASTGAATVAVQ